MRMIVCASHRYACGSIIAGVRHYDNVIRRQANKQNLWTPAEQGFLDNRGEFLTRTEAWKVAEAAGQITRRVGGDKADGGTLYSENLY